MLIDCANYYRALHQAIVKARHSIFIFGWEIDSRVRLLRGEEERKSSIPSVAVELLEWKAKQDPHVSIYLCRWDASVVFVTDRDLMPELVWSSRTPENVHTCVDGKVPIGGSHHQKIILIDDELAFTGGMDIARQRWDERTHKILEPERTDANGSYGPYHDVQTVMDGPITKDIAELTRKRWLSATGYEAIPIREFNRKEKKLVPSWPESFPPHMMGCEVAIARTLPRIENQDAVQEIRHQYLDLIQQAEQFIYIENQFLTAEFIAKALNKRLKEIPNLKVLIVSSYNPQGMWERESLWAGRIDFKNIVEEGLGPERVRITYSKIKDAAGKPYYKRIHSKIFVIDNKFLTVASSNLNHRSMIMDTECDVTYIAQSAEHRRQIEYFRNDLIAEHTGRTPEDVNQILSGSFTLKQLMNSDSNDTYSLHDIDDTRFTNKSLQALTSKFADPEEPLMSYVDLTSSAPKIEPFRNPPKHRLVLYVALGLLILGLIFYIRDHLDWFTPKKVQLFLEYARNSSFALPLVCTIYIVGGLIFFPVTVISLMTAAVFGAFLGPIYCMAGALSSAAVMFWMGRFAGLKGLRKFLGNRVRSIDQKFHNAGIFGVAAIRFLPIAPYSLVNLAAGISTITFFDYIVGTFFGFLPGFIVKGLVGDSLIRIFISPTPETTFYLIIGIILWIGLMAFSYFFARKMQRRQAV